MTLAYIRPQSDAGAFVSFFASFAGFDDSVALPESLLPVSAVAALSDAFSFGGSPSLLKRFRCLSFLKSVSYQPWPFSRKRGAEISRRSCGFPHSGQSTSGASLIFCNASSVWLHSLQAYS